MTSIHTFLQELPNKIPVAALEGKNTILHFDISGENGGKYTLSVADNQIQVQEGLIGAAKSVISTSDKVFSDLVQKEASPMMALMTGRLKVSNPAEIMQYLNILGLM